MKKYQSSQPELRVGDTSSQKLQPLPNQSSPFPSSLATEETRVFLSQADLL